MSDERHFQHTVGQHYMNRQASGASGAPDELARKNLRNCPLCGSGKSCVWRVVRLQYFRMFCIHVRRLLTCPVTILYVFVLQDGDPPIFLIPFTSSVRELESCSPNTSSRARMSPRPDSCLQQFLDMPSSSSFVPVMC